MATVVAMLEYRGDLFRVTQDHWDADDPDFTEDTSLEHLVRYMWTEGNYSCDCNRLLFTGLDEDEEVPCGNRMQLLSLQLDGKELL